MEGLLYYVGAVVLLLIVFILINSLIAGCFYDVAKEKGFSRKCYFWIPFFFGFIGYILVLALPDRGNSQQG